MMPQMDGYEVLLHIRGDDSIRHFPVIALTAKAMVGDKEKCIRAGASDYHAKPIDIQFLLSQINSYVQSSGLAANS